MNSKQISIPMGIAIGAVALVIILALGYKFFLAPPSYQDATPTGQKTNMDAGTAAHYPGGSAAGAPAPSTP